MSRATTIRFDAPSSTWVLIVAELIIVSPIRIASWADNQALSLLQNISLRKLTLEAFHYARSTKFLSPFAITHVKLRRVHVGVAVAAFSNCPQLIAFEATSFTSSDIFNCAADMAARSITMKHLRSLLWERTHFDEWQDIFVRLFYLPALKIFGWLHNIDTAWDGDASARLSIFISRLPKSLKELSVVHKPGQLYGKHIMSMFSSSLQLTYLTLWDWGPESILSFFRYPRPAVVQEGRRSILPFPRLYMVITMSLESSCFSAEEHGEILTAIRRRLDSPILRVSVNSMRTG